MCPLVAFASADPADTTERRYAAVSLRPTPAITAIEDDESMGAADWFPACYQLTPGVERASSRSAILDLGICTQAEATAALQELLDSLEQRGLRPRVGIGPTPVLAQLTCLMAPAHDQLCSPPLISLSAASAFLKRVPIERLLQLASEDAITVETLTRLRRCGVQTLGQLARLDDLTLRRQFGAVGAHLVALAQGSSLHPFSPTAPALSLRFRLRMGSSLCADDALRQLPRLATRMAKTLREQGYEAGQIAVVISWTSGGRLQVNRDLRWRTSNARLLAQELTRLVLPLLRHGSERQTEEQIEEIRCALSALQRPRPSQALLFPQGRSTLSARRAQLRDVADTLAQRRQRPVLLAPRRIAAHAIFSEDGYVLAPLGSAAASVASAGAAEPSATSQRQDHWQDAPLRLHWW